jgi:hypothetical protein
MISKRVPSARRAKSAKAEAPQQLESEYDSYRDRVIDRYIAANATTFEALKNAKWQEDRERFSFATESMARIAARIEFRKQITLLTFDDFLEHRRRGSDFQLTLARFAPAAEPLADTIDVEDLLAIEERREAENSALASAREQSVSESAPLDATGTVDAASVEAPVTPPALDPANDIIPPKPQEYRQQPANEVAEPMMIELASESPREELGGMVEGQMAA